MKKILVCTCFRMDKKASEAFSLLFPTDVLPDIIKGKERIRKFGEEIKNDHIIAISKLSGKFAYYVEFDSNKIIQEYNLLSGKRTA